MNIAKKKKKSLRAGFTLIELMTVFVISTIIGTVVIANYPNFSSKIEFENLALDIALTLREAQVYGMGTKEAAAGFDVAYGVHFDVTASNTFLLFMDLNGNGKYDSSPTDEIVGTSYTIKSMYKIEQTCATRAAAQQFCNLLGAPLDVTFKRPDPDAIIRMGAYGDYYRADIEVLNTKDNRIKTITVTNTGQISVP